MGLVASTLVPACVCCYDRTGWMISAQKDRMETAHGVAGRHLGSLGYGL